MPAAPPLPPTHVSSSSVSPPAASVDFAHRSPTQHARQADASMSAALKHPLLHAADNDMADTTTDEHTKQHANKEHKHAELFVHTTRPNAIPAADASALVSVVPPAGLHSHSPSSSAEPSSTHSHSSTQSSTDCSPAMAYRGLQISVASHANSGDRQATSSQSGSASSATITDSSDGSTHGNSGSVHPASGNQDAMQLATPHPVPASTQGVTHAGSVASASSPSPASSKADVDMPTPAHGSNGTTPAAAIKAEPSSAMESECSSAASTPASAAIPVSATPATDSTPASSSSSSSSSSSAPEKKSGGRYKPVRTLQNSLFGQVQLAFDSHKGVEVAVKVSHADLVNPKNQGAAASSSTADAAATARSQAGVSVLEDVRREARILRLLLGADQPAFSTAAIDDASCGLSNALLNAIHLPANAIVQPGATNPLTIKQQFLDSISKGKKSIAGFYDEVEAESFHYLISEYIAGGDLFSVLTAQPAHKIRLIDFGLAAQHPRYAGDKRTILPDGSVQRNASNHIRLLSESAATSSCDCAACKTTSEKLKESDPAILTALKAGFPLHKLRFLCRPVCEKVHKPGKLGYMSPELYQNQAWDAYAHDIFGLGVILYSMLTGRPPFTRPDEASDVWFRVLHSGQWLMPQVRQQPPASIYTSLSPNALHLIDLLIKPQHMRPSIDVVLKHPWLNPSHPGNAGAIPSSKLALGSRGAGLQLGKDGRKIVQRRGSD